MPHYYSKEQTSELNLMKISIRIANEVFELYSGSGVFSKKRLDKGTELLLKNLMLEGRRKVLDLGCGIGVAGIYAKMKSPDIELTLSDVNERAVKLCKKNLKLYGMEGRVRQSDGMEKVKGSFDLILLNPPQVAGRDTCIRLFKESYEHLEEGGVLQVVARHNKGGKTLSHKMEEIFGNMEELAKGSGYRVYISRKTCQKA